MVQEAVACDGCAKSIEPHAEPRDLAHVNDPRHFCPLCRLLFCPAPTPTMVTSFAAGRRAG